MSKEGSYHSVSHLDYVAKRLKSSINIKLFYLHCKVNPTKTRILSSCIYIHYVFPLIEKAWNIIGKPSVK